MRGAAMTSMLYPALPALPPVPRMTGGMPRLSTRSSLPAYPGALGLRHGHRLVFEPCLPLVSKPSLPPNARFGKGAKQIVRECRHGGIPINVTDMPDLCDFSFMSTQRFADAESGKPSGGRHNERTWVQTCRSCSSGRHRKSAGGSSECRRLRDLAYATDSPDDLQAKRELHEDGPTRLTSLYPSLYHKGGHMKRHLRSGRRCMVYEVGRASQPVLADSATATSPVSKCPGNAEGAQMELMEAAVEAARRGLNVVRRVSTLSNGLWPDRRGSDLLASAARGFEPWSCQA
ncbi:hypothetical protein OH77DRAFT_43863 [Trametes cingulata]|nr:hypothetical protein OH77DRAFT_43863 [Trametes cingulata]